jgi:hypothetical protein
LLGARRHAGGGAAALHVEDHRRDFGEIGEADELLHQRDAGTGGGGEGARAVPAGADDDADRGQFVLGLHDGVALCGRSAGRCAFCGNTGMKASASEVDGVIGYQAQTVAPP